MDQMKHTPGPWRIGDGGITIFGPKTAAPAPVTIANIAKAGGACHANAHLVAAAPELLEALRAIAAQARVTGNTFPNAPGNGDLRNIYQIAQEAIAKAAP